MCCKKKINQTSMIFSVTVAQELFFNSHWKQFIFEIPPNDIIFFKNLRIIGHSRKFLPEKVDSPLNFNRAD